MWLQSHQLEFNMINETVSKSYCTYVLIYIKKARSTE